MTNAALSAIADTECGCSNSSCSTSCRTVTSPTGSSQTVCGVMQMTTATAKQVACENGLPDCSLTLDQMAQKLQDPATNIQYATLLYNSLLNSSQVQRASVYSGIDPTLLAAAAYNGGLGAVEISTKCPGTLAYECTQNNYGETITYVQNLSTKLSIPYSPNIK